VFQWFEVNRLLRGSPQKEALSIGVDANRLSAHAALLQSRTAQALPQQTIVRERTDMS